MDNMDFDLPPPPLASSSQSEPMVVAAPPKMSLTADEIKKWTVLYPAYFDQNLSRSSGRRVERDAAYPNPDLQHILEACRMALGSLSPPMLIIPERKRHPQDPLRIGRLRVQIRDKTGNLVHPTVVPNKEILMKLVASKLEAAKGAAEFARKKSEEMFRQQQEMAMRQAAMQQKAAQKGGNQGPMSLPAMMGAGGGMYQPSEAMKKVSAMPYAAKSEATKEAGKNLSIGGTATKGKGKS